MKEPKTILLVENEDAVRADETRVLEGEGYAVVAVPTGEEAIEAVRTTPAIGLILMAVELGSGMDGVRWAGAILEDDDIPIVFISSHTGKEVVDRTDEVASYGYVVRGTGDAVLAASVRRAFTLHESRRELAAKEKALRDSEMKARALLNAVEESVWLFALDGAVLDANPTAAARVGSPVEDLIGKREFQGIPPQITKSRQERVAEVGRTGVPLRFEDERNGIVFEHNLYPVKDEKGNITAVASFSKDITGTKRIIGELRASEQGLLQARELLEAVTTGAKVLIVALDRELRFTYFNQKHFEEIKRITGKEIAVGMSLMDVFADMPQERASLLDRWSRTLGGETFDLTLPFGVAGRRPRWYSSRHIPIRDASGAVVGGGRVTTDVTELMEAQEAVRRSEELLRAIADNSPDPIFLKDRECRFLMANPAALAAIGKAAGEVIGKTSGEVYDDPGIGRIIMETDRRVMDSARTEVVEEVLRDQKGERIFLSTKSPYHDASGEVIGLVGVSREITDRKLAEEALERERLSLQAIFDAAQVGMALVDVRGVVTRVNLTLARMVGKDVAEMVGRVVGDGLCCVHAAGVVQGCGNSSACPQCPIRETFSTVLRTGEVIGGVESATQIISNGVLREFCFSISASPVILKGEKHVLLAILDITEQKRAEAALRESEERFSQIAEQTREIIWEMDGRGLYTYVSRGFEPILGYATEEVIGKMHFYDLYPEEGRESSREATFTVLERKEQFHDLANRVITKNGEELMLMSNGMPILDTEGNLLGYRGSDSDITARKRAEETLRASLAEKEILLREVHHRVKNNLAAIVALLDMQRQTINDSDATEALKDLGSRIKSMALVHERLYRSENLAVIDMEDYLKSLISHLRSSFGPHSTIRWRVQAKDVEMSLDAAVPCGMIVNELVSNALKHAFPGGDPRPGQNTADILVSLTHEGTRYTLTVADNGVEIPAAFDWEKTKSLGLRLVRMLGQHQLGGKLRLDRKNGTSFTLTFSHKR